MKRLFCITVLSAFVAVGSLFAQQGGGFVNPAQRGGKGGFQQSATGPEVLSVAQAKAMPDDAMVFLRGSIIEQIGDEKYRFKDVASEDTIVIEVDDDKWNGQTITPKDTILIYGEVDKGLLSEAEIDVKQVRKERALRASDGRNVPAVRRGAQGQPAAVRQRQAVAPENCPHCSQSLAPASAGEPSSEAPARPRAGSNARGRR